MCQYKSAIAMKEKIILAPDGNESHSNLLVSLGLDDNTYNAMRKFVRLELIPPKGNREVDISKWTFIVDQDIIPDWYAKDPGKYEEMLRKEVEDHLKNSDIINICGYSWTSIEKEYCTYYIMDGYLNCMSFGMSDNFAESYIFEMLNNCGLNEELQKTFGNRLLNIETDLSSYHNCRRYRTIESKLTLPTVNFICENSNKFNSVFYNHTFWTATPSDLQNYVTCYYNNNVFFKRSHYREVALVRPMFALKN